MKYIKTYEGLFDFFKKKKYRDYFTLEESSKIKDSLSIDNLIKIAETKEWRKENDITKNIEIFIGKASRSSLSTQYLTDPQGLLITKQDQEYKLITFQDDHNFAEDSNPKRYKTIEEVIFECKKYITYCLVSVFIEPKKLPDLSWNNFDVSEEQFLESKSLVEDYSVINNKGKLNEERLNMLIDDYLEIDEDDEYLPGDWRNHIDSVKSNLINHLKNYFD